MDFDGIGRVATNTTLAACAGGLVAMFFVYPRSKKWDTGITVNGFLAGLVAITAPCYWVNPTGCDHHRRDRRRDRGASASTSSSGSGSTTRSARSRCTASAASGARSASACSPPASSASPARPAPTSRRTVDGLFYGGGTDQLVAQLIGSAVVTVVALAAGLALMYASRPPARCGSREEGELEGIDIHEHGAPAYHPEPATPATRRCRRAGLQRGYSAAADADATGISVGD